MEQQPRRGRRPRKRDQAPRGATSEQAQNESRSSSGVSSKAKSERVFNKQLVKPRGAPEVLQPGLVLFRNAMDAARQREWVETAMAMGSEGFYQHQPDGAPARLNQGNRGRIIEPIDAFPEEFATLCREKVAEAMSVDPSMPSMEPTTALVNFYNPKATFKWHRDSEDPELIKRKQGFPVVSVSLGLSAEFGYKLHQDEPHQVLRLNSGDILLFGGPSRMLLHSVLSIIPNTMPGHLQGLLRLGRVNMTFRQVEGFIDPTAFPAYRVRYDIEEEHSTPAPQREQPASQPASHPSGDHERPWQADPSMTMRSAALPELASFSSYSTSVCLVPPRHLWRPIQALRRQHHSVFARWPPHVNLAYPFTPESDFASAAAWLQHSLVEVSPFTIELGSTTGFFTRKRDAVVYLGCGRTPVELQQIHATVHQAAVTSTGGNRGQRQFVPHLTLGEWPKAEAAEAVRRLCPEAVSYTHLRAHETPEHLVCRLLLEKKKNT
eukprot:TRINITY_DN28151_c0_g1_i2.p1 TRINITY_DN28151_c0_g1~~TRINITY_DN28151_c0_g1_i2.p1  ORF type:complete len:492 (-),score=108.97 TRINITY_DN28151_c0_g1_i2:12-1487(-)